MAPNIWVGPRLPALDMQLLQPHPGICCLEVTAKQAMLCQVGLEQMRSWTRILKDFLSETMDIQFELLKWDATRSVHFLEYL